MSESNIGMCTGLCVTAADIGVGVAGNPVAYPYPGCPEHGTDDYCEHCEGWGNFEGRETEEERLICPMCEGTGIREKTP